MAFDKVKVGAAMLRMQEDFDTVIKKHNLPVAMVASALGSELGVLMQVVARKHPEHREFLKGFAKHWYETTVASIEDPDGFVINAQKKHGKYTDKVLRELGKTSEE